MVIFETSRSAEAVEIEVSQVVEAMAMAEGVAVSDVAIRLVISALSSDIFCAITSEILPSLLII